MKKYLFAITIFVLITGVFFEIKKMRGAQYLEQQCRVLMTTYVTVYAYGKKPAVSVAIDKAFKRMQEVTDKFNAHNAGSPLYAFNNKGIPIEDAEVLKVIKTSLDISRLSEGAFDITVYPLVKLWGFYEDKTDRVPSGDEINQALKKVGYKHLIFTGKELRKDRDDLFIDLGGIAKGYVVGQGIEELKKSGIKSAIIQAGGDIFVLGSKGGKPWKIGIRHPRKEEGLLGYVEVEDMAVMSSGDYERFFVKGNKRYNHIINPKTGYPAAGAIGVTVIYPDPSIADAWGPTLAIMGPAGLNLVEKIPGMEAIMVTENGKIQRTRGFDKLRAL